MPAHLSRSIYTSSTGLFMKRALVFITISILTCSVYATAQRTTRRGIDKTIKTTTKQKNPGNITSGDTIISPSSETIKLSGYDKPLNATKETLFITNNTEHHLLSISINCSYLDTNGRQLHQRDVVIPCDIPPGETRIVSFPSWDKQKSFYYIRSRKPKRGIATPYNISCNTNFIVIQP